MKNWSYNDFTYLNENYRNGKNSFDLKKRALDLFECAKKELKTGVKDFEKFRNILRSLTVSFEVVEYYLDLPKDFAEYFTKELNEFLTITPVGKKAVFDLLKNKLKDFAAKNKTEFNISDGQIFREFATEVLLLNTCGIVSLYRQNQDKEALSKLRLLKQFILCLADEKAKSRVQFSNIESHLSVGNSLTAYIYYLEGKILFAKGEYNAALACFDYSSDEYLKKILISTENDSAGHNTRMVATRRYCLSNIFGKAYIYQTRGELTKALEICNRNLPLLRNTGKVFEAYAKMIHIYIVRGLNSFNLTILKTCLNELLEIREIFESEVSNSHYLQRCNLEICLVKLYLVFSSDFQTKLETFQEVEEIITKVINSDVCDQKMNPNRNLRLLAESYSLLSYIIRNFPDSDNQIKLNNINRAIQFGKQAVHFSNGKSQLYCDCLLTYGIAYQEKYEYFFRKYQNYVRETIKPFGDGAKKILTEMKKNKNKALKCYFGALRNNHDKNQRIEAIAWLRLTDLEIYDHNLHFAVYNYDKFKELQVEHKYVLRFAQEVHKRMEELKMYATPFFLGPDDDQTGYYTLNDKLKEFLVQKVVIKLIADLEEKFPIKERKGTKKEFDSLTDNKHTRHNLLINAFITHLKLKEEDAELWWKDYKDKVDNWVDLYLQSQENEAGAKKIANQDNFTN